MATAQTTFTHNGMVVVLVQLPVAISASVITPIVFCASLVPCASDTSEALPIWPQRKPVSRYRSATPRVIRYTTQVPTAATTPAITGDMTAGSTTLPSTPSSLLPLPFQLTPDQPRPAMVAPIRPPNSACDELDGRPSSQVSRFQTIAPTRPARMIRSRSVPPLASSSFFGAPLELWIRTTALVTVNAT